MPRPVADSSSSAEKVRQLCQPEAYPFPVRRIDLIETHMSWVFLTEERVYKLKKPVRRSFLDFSTVAARQRNAETEVRLNRRLAPWVYLGVVPLTNEPDGRLRVAGNAEVVDWLVDMRRLPGEQMLDRRIAHAPPSGTEIRAVARTLAWFYRSLPAEPITGDTYRKRLLDDTRDTCRELRRPEFGLPSERIRRVEQALLDLLQHQARAFDRRVAAGCIVEGHGDLRPEHICLLDSPVVIDCLEFNRDLRILDYADELAFLALECERLGGKAIGEAILDACWEELGLVPPAPLLQFHGAHRACVRAKLAVWHNEDHQDQARWRARALAYLAQAEARLGLTR